MTAGQPYNVDYLRASYLEPAVQSAADEIERLTEINAELLSALISLLDANTADDLAYIAVEAQARAAIAKALGKPAS